MELHYLKLFHTVAEYESFTKASEVLHISQPALSIQIKKLEENLKIKLFDKIGNKIILNENGKVLFAYTQKIFNIIEEAEATLLKKRTEIGGVINVGGSNTPGTYILPQIIGHFKNTYPNVTINLHISTTDEIARRVENGSLDFAVNGGVMPYSNSIYTEKLIEDPLVIAASLNCIYAQKEYVTHDELKSLNFIVHESNSQLFRTAKSFIDTLNAPFEQIRLTLGNIDAIKQAVIANLGVSLIPKSAIMLELKLGIIKELKYTGNQLFYPYNLIYNKNKYLSLGSHKLIVSVRETITSLHSDQHLQ